jgi:FlaA1/EpsC-like NDP-sugar epimerase
MAGRIIADGIMVNAAMLITLVSRYMWLVGINGSTLSAQVLFREHMRVYVNSFWFLTIVCLVVFYFNGFYTYGRFYQDRYKVLVIAQAVSLGYLIFGFFIFILSDWIFFPRSILIPAWLVTLVFLIGSRAFLELYRTVKLPERRQTAPIVVENKRNKVLVIGGAGYIGSALLPKLLKKGCHVRLLDLLLYGTEPIQEILHHPDLEIIRADFRQIDTVVEAMRDIGAVVHLGAIVGDPACDLNEELTIEVNLMATRMLGEVAKQWRQSLHLCQHLFRLRLQR